MLLRNKSQHVQQKERNAPAIIILHTRAHTHRPTVMTRWWSLARGKKSRIRKIQVSCTHESWGGGYKPLTKLGLLWIICWWLMSNSRSITWPPELETHLNLLPCACKSWLTALEWHQNKYFSTSAAITDRYRSLISSLREWWMTNVADEI